MEKPDGGRPSIPPPRSISAPAQRFLASQSKQAPYPPATDKSAWRAYIKAADEADARQTLPNLSALKAKVEEQVLGGVPVHVARPDVVMSKSNVVMYFHGGAFVFGSGALTGFGTAFQAVCFRAPVYGVDYRTPPDHPFPAGLDDCLEAYRGLLKRHPARTIAFLGVSAGGALATATCLRAREAGLPLPSSLALVAPQLDLTESGDSHRTNLGLDPCLQQSLSQPIALYADGRDLSEPLLSPLFADFKGGFPPTIIQTGTRDLLLSDAVRMHRRLRDAGMGATSAVLNVWEGAPHGGFGYSAPEDYEMLAELRTFITAHWGRT